MGFFCFGWRVGEPNMALAIFGVGFILWCERSEHDKINLATYSFNHSFFSLIISRFQRTLKVRFGVVRCPQNGIQRPAAWRSGG